MGRRKPSFPAGLEWLEGAPADDLPEWFEWIQRCPPRHATRRRWERPTLGHQVAATARLLGWEFMPWQRFVVDVAYEYHLIEVDAFDDNGEPITVEVPQLYYRTITGTVPRQSGKTTLGLPVKVHRCVVFPELGPPPYGGPQFLFYTAQDRNKAYQKWVKEHVPRIERARALNGLHKVRRTNGSEGINWTNGSWYGIEATTETAGHGDTLDLHFGDEIFAHSDFRLDQAARPAMITRPNAQQWLWSTQGDDSSIYLNTKCDQGRAAVAEDLDSRIAYFECAAPKGAELDDPSVWPKFHPAVGYTQTVETLMAEALEMKPDEAKRAFFNWKKAGRTFAQKIPAELWERLADPVATTGPIALAIDIPPDRSAAYIAWAGFGPDGLIEGELDHREIVDPLEAPDRLLEIIEANDVITHHKSGQPIVAINPVGPVGAIASLLERLDIHVEKMSARTYSAACGLLFDLILHSRFRHPGQPELDAAVTNTGERRIGEAFGWDAIRTQPDIDPETGIEGDPPPPISPLNAVTIAIGALVGADEADEEPTKTPVARVVDLDMAL